MDGRYTWPGCSLNDGMMPMPTPLYLLIAGAPKCGTSSLFSYLKDHPDVCACRFKEPRFFADEVHMTSVQPPFVVAAARRKDFAVYQNLFPCSERSVWCEASPVYIYSRAAAERIKAALPRVKLVFILREPVDRLVSSFLMLHRIHRLPRHMTFEAFVQMQSRDDTDNMAESRLVWGCYSRYLKIYYDLFDPQDILVVGFHQLRDSPLSVMQQISEFAGIDPEFYQGFDFRVYNRAGDYRVKWLDSVYQRGIHWVRNRIVPYPRFFTPLHALNERYFIPLYESLNRTDAPKPDIPAHVRAELEAFYADEADELYKLTGKADLLQS